MSRALGLEPVPGRRALRAAALPAVACLMLGIAVAAARGHDDDGALRPHLVGGGLRHRRLTVDDGVVRPRRADPARSGAIDRRGAARVRSRRPGRAQRSHRPRPAVRVPDARPADILRDARAAACRRSRRRRRRSRTSPRASSRSPRSARDGFYKPGTEHRTCVLVTDGETRTDTSWNGGCKLLVVRVGVGDRPHLRGERQGRCRLPPGEHGGGHGRPAGSRGRVGAVLGRGCRRRRECAAAHRRCRPEPPGRHGSVGPRTRAVLRCDRAAHCYPRSRAPLSSTRGWRLTRAEAS